ncbi:hypothetical protein INT43_007247 [Umbelopsis isabellina]|uniref:F-box domain-containing protein n=1 Tax=Mortierella isabellina TaxID=91625 RepID=A0A8H7UHW2_MORIS|nr:hypothetical protein INT43_007247 [Umbelopsis isabellina]
MSSICDSENSTSSTPPLVPPMDVEMEDVQPASATFPSSSSAGRVSGHGGISGSYTVGVRPSSKKFKNKHTTGSLNRLQQQTHGLHIDEGFFQRLTPKPFFVGKRFDILGNLPYELATLIFSYLDPSSLLRMMLVNKSWHTVARDNELWKRKFAANPSWRVNIPVQHLDEMDWRHLYSQRYQLEQRWNTGKVSTFYLTGHTDSVYCLQFDDEKIVTGSRDRTIKFWNMNTRECVHTLTGHEKSVLCLRYNNEIMVSGSSDQAVIVWDMKTLQIIHKLQGHQLGVLDVAFDDKYIVSCSKDTTIRIWDRVSGQLIRILEAHRGPVNAVQLKDNIIVSASGDTFIKMWDIETGQCLRELDGHTRGLACVQYDGYKIVSGSNDKRIKVWDAKSGQCMMTCEGHTDLVRTIKFDEEKMISASYDQSIRVWDLRTGTPLLNFQSGHLSWVFDVHFNRTKIVSCCQGPDQQILIMDFGQGLDTKYFI